MELTVLGAQGTWPGAGGENCGYLISENGYHLQVDAGTGTFARLQQVVGVDDVGSMLITHGHPDHFVDIIPTFYARHYGRLGAPGLPFWSPGGFTDIAANLVAENGRNVMAEAFDFRTAVAGEVFELGPFRITPFEMQHIGVLSLGYRIEAGGVGARLHRRHGTVRRRRSRSGVDADLFLCEATYQNASKLYPFHLSAAQAGEVATAAGVDHLVLTHLTPGARPSRVDPRGGRDVHRARSTSRSPGCSSRWGDERAPDGRAPGQLRSGGLRARLPGVGRRLGAVLDGEDPGAVRRLRVDRSAALAARHGQGVGDGGVLDAAGIDERAFASRGEPRTSRAAGPRRSSG